MPDGISRGFQTSTLETALFLGVLGVIVLGLIIYQIIKARRVKQPRPKKEGAPEPVLRHRTRSRRDLITLSSREQRTLDHLAWFLKDPSRQDRLIDDDRLLLRAARRGIREGIVQEADVLRLLNRLEVDAAELDRGGRDSNTVPTGAEVSISDRNLNMATGELLLSDTAGLRVRLEKQARELTARTAVEVVCNAADGLYRFHSAILERDGKEVVLQHSRHVEHVQRRKFRRRETELDVSISIPGIQQKPIKSRTEDLSIGGAALRNPRKRIITGTRIDCTLDAGGAAPITIPGTVLRTSRRGKTIHVSFGPMDDKTRHRLFKRVISLDSSR